jgi:hypothetical protein
LWTKIWVVIAGISVRLVLSFIGLIKRDWLSPAPRDISPRNGLQGPPGLQRKDR